MVVQKYKIDPCDLHSFGSAVISYGSVVKLWALQSNHLVLQSNLWARQSNCDPHSFGIAVIYKHLSSAVKSLGSVVKSLGSAVKSLGSAVKLCSLKGDVKFSFCSHYRVTKPFRWIS